MLTLSLVWPAAVARAAASCSFDEGTGLVSVTAMHGDVATISRLGDAIAVDGVACETATVTNTESIDVAFPDDPDTDTVVVDLSGGARPRRHRRGGGIVRDRGRRYRYGTAASTRSGSSARPEPDAFATSFLAVNLNTDETVP